MAEVHHGVIDLLGDSTCASDLLYKVILTVFDLMINALECSRLGPGSSNRITPNLTS